MNLNNIILKIKSTETALYNSKFSWILIIVFLIIPPVACLIFIIQFGVNVCYWDQWEIVPLFDKYYTGQLSFNDFFVYHNEHILFFPRIVMLVIGVITHYNNIAEMLFSWFLLVLTSVFLYKAYSDTYGFSKNALIKFIPVVWLIFSLRQWGNLLWGFQIQWFINSLALIASLYFLQKSKTIDWYYIGAILCGLIASFSSMPGLLIWPVGIFHIVFNGICYKKYSINFIFKYVPLWLVAGIAVYIIYFINNTSILSKVSTFHFEDIGSTVLFFITAFGNPLGINDVSCIVFGILLLFIFALTAIYLVLNRQNFKNKGTSFSLSLIIFAFIFYLMIVIGRAKLGIDQAVSSTYATVTILGIVGIYLLVLGFNIKSDRYKLYLAVIIISGMIFTYAVVFTVIGPYTQANKLQDVHYLTTFQNQNDENLKNLYPLTDIVRKRAAILQKYNLNVFYDNN